MADNEVKVLALLPAYNESAHLEKVLTGVKKHISDVLVVDDGSADQTAEIARRCGAEVLARGYNSGKGQSLKDGYSWALSHGYDAVIMLDSDGQHDPVSIPDFIEKFKANRPPLIIGARDYNQMPLRRRIPNVVSKIMFCTAIGRNIPDAQSGYRMLNRMLMERMLQSKEKGYQFEVEMIAVCVAENWTIDWVPIATIYGDEQSKQKVMDQILTFPRVCLNANRMVREKRKK